MNQSTAKIILIQNMHRVWGIDSEEPNCTSNKHTHGL